MPHKNPEDKKKYMADYYVKNRTEKRAKIKKAKKDAFKRDPDAVRAQWRKDRANARMRKALKEAEAAKAQPPKVNVPAQNANFRASLLAFLSKPAPTARPALKMQAKPTTGYVGPLKPNHF